MRNPIRQPLFFILLHLILVASAMGYDVLFVQSSRNPAYDEALRGFSSVCGASSRSIVLTDYAEVDVPRTIREDRPRVVVVLGDQAYAAAKKQREIPVLALMALGLTGARATSGSAGVTVFSPPEAYLPVFQRLKVRKVGVVFDRANTGWYVDQMSERAGRFGITVVTREIRDGSEVAAKLGELAGNVDALWLVPDLTAVTRETLPAFIDFSSRNSIPIVSFTAAHVRRGAAAAVEIDRVALGRQVGEMAEEILHGATNLPVVPPRATTIIFNKAALKGLGLPAAVPE